MMKIRPFHVAFPVTNLTETRYFYETILGCPVGRTSDKWIDFSLFGHQITAHLCLTESARIPVNTVDGKEVPVRHWGVILEMTEWQALADRLQGQDIDFVIKPYLRFQGEIGEQATMFFLDPSGNALEFKAFKNDEMIFQSTIFEK